MSPLRCQTTIGLPWLPPVIAETVDRACFSSRKMSRSHSPRPWSTSACGLVSKAHAFTRDCPNPISCLKMKAADVLSTWGRKQSPKCLCLHDNSKELPPDKLLLEFMTYGPCLTYQAPSKLPNLEYSQKMCSTVTDHAYYIISMLNTEVSWKLYFNILSQSLWKMKNTSLFPFQAIC